MAWLRPLGNCTNCSQPATVELMSIRNESHGKFCKKHGEVARGRLNRIEQDAMRR